MCIILSELIKSYEDSSDEITCISVRNEILIGFPQKWSFDDFLAIISSTSSTSSTSSIYCKFKLLVEILERREGWDCQFTQLIYLLQEKDDDGILCELKLSLIYLLTTKIDKLDAEVESKFLIISRILNDILSKMHIASLKFLPRHKFFNIITKLIDINLTINNHANDLFDDGFCNKICNHIKGEKDPRNLLLMFPLLKKLSIHYSKVNDDPDSLVEISQILLAYYPINFKLPRGAPQSITENDLINSLNDALSAPSLYIYTMDIFLDGLYGNDIVDDEELDFLAKNVQTIAFCVPKYGQHCILNYMSQVIEAISTEIFLSKAPVMASSNVYIVDKMSIEDIYEIGFDLENCKKILELPKWLPNKKVQLLADVLKVFLQNIPNSHVEFIWKNVSFLLEKSDISIISDSTDLKASLYLIKIITDFSPSGISSMISDFLNKIITMIPIKVESMPTIAQILAIIIVDVNKNSNKIAGGIANKLSNILEYIKSFICNDIKQFVEIIQVISTLFLPDDFVDYVCTSIHNMDNFIADSENIINFLSQQKGAQKFLTKLFLPIKDALSHISYNDYNLTTVTNESLFQNVEKASSFFNYLSQNTILLRYSSQVLRELYDQWNDESYLKLNDKSFLKRLFYIWAISAIATSDNTDIYFWYEYTKSLGVMDEMVQKWTCQIISAVLLSKNEFLKLIDIISSNFTCEIVDFILSTYTSNPFKLIFIPWLDRFYNKNHYYVAEKITQDFKTNSYVPNKDLLELSLSPILLKFTDTNNIKFNTSSYYTNVTMYLFELIKQSEISNTDLWSDYINEMINFNTFDNFFIALSDLLDELCPLRVIPGESWQIVLDTWSISENYFKSIRINKPNADELTNLLLDKLYYVQSGSCFQRILFANAILDQLDKYLSNGTEYAKINTCKIVIRLLSSLPPSSIDKKWINLVIQSVELVHCDWEDLRLLCLLVKLSKCKLINSCLQEIGNLSVVVKYIVRKRNAALSRTISLLAIKELWSIINSSLEEDLIRVTVEYVNTCGKDPKIRVRRMALSCRTVTRKNCCNGY